MRIGVINVKNLSRVRKTFRPGWRIFIIIIFLLLVLLWWSAFHQIRHIAQLVTDGSLRLRTLILAIVLLPTLTVALFRKGDFARLIFTLITGFTILSIFPILLVVVYLVATMSREDGTALTFAIIGLFIAFMTWWEFMIRHGYVLLLSLMPFSRLKAYRHQVNNSLRLWSGQRKGREESQAVGESKKLYLNSGSRYRLALGYIALAIGILCFPLTLFALMNKDFFPAIYRLDFSTAWHMLRNFQSTLPDPGLTPSSVEWVSVISGILVMLIGFAFFFIFGYFWTQWQRENISIYRVPLLQHMTSSDLLLLRSFKDDAKMISREQRYIWLMPLAIYSWAFTFEQVIVDRMSYLGKVRLIDITQENEELLDKWWLKGFVKLLGRERMKKFLVSIFPAIWYKLPPKGGIRYYLETKRNDEAWKAEIGQAMSLSRMIVVVLGTTDSLQWEMGQIEQLHLEKTVFMMPPLILKKNYLARWQQFIDKVCKLQAHDKEALKKLNPKRILAACVRENSLVIIIGNRNANSQLNYESAIDVATILTITDPAHSGKMIPKYLT